MKTWTRFLAVALVAAFLLSGPGAAVADDPPTQPAAVSATNSPDTGADIPSGENVGSAAAPGADQPKTDADKPPDTDLDKDASIGEAVEALVKVIDNWESVGWVAGVIALINLLMVVLRIKQIHAWFTAKGLKWLKPLIACVLGGAFGGFSSYATGAGVVGSIAGGVIAALGSVGFHQLVSGAWERKG